MSLNTAAVAARRLLAILVMALVVGSPVAQAQCTDVQRAGFDEQASSWTAPAGYVLLCPQGDGVMSVPITVWAKNDCNPPGVPFPAIEADDIHVYWSGSHLSCALTIDEHIIKWQSERWHADTPTDQDGKTIISSTPCASGFATYGQSGQPAVGKLMVAHLDFVFPTPPGNYDCIPIAVRSPDINLNGVVNLVDYSLFALEWQKNCSSTDIPCQKADFNLSGKVDLVDLTIFGNHNGHTCQSCPLPTQSCPQ